MYFEIILKREGIK